MPWIKSSKNDFTEIQILSKEIVYPPSAMDISFNANNIREISKHLTNIEMSVGDYNVKESLHDIFNEKRVLSKFASDNNDDIVRSIKILSDNVYGTYCDAHDALVLGAKELDKPEPNVDNIFNVFHKLIFKDMFSLRNQIEQYKRDSGESHTAKKKKKLDIEEAIKKPGSLRRHFGLKKGEKVPMRKARAEYKSLQGKAKKGDLTENELSLLRKLSFFLNVLSKTKK